MAGAKQYSANCLCGAVKATIIGEPNWVGHCHCPSCQKATSAGFATYAGYDRSAVQFTENAPKVYKSSPGVKRRFCDACGSPVSFEGETWPNEIHLHLAFIDQSADFKPTGHTYVKTQMPWVHLDDGLTRFETFPDKES